MTANSLWNTLRWRWTMWMDGAPAEIRNGRPVVVEERLSTLRPVPLVVQPDAIYQTADGRLIVVETKTRGEWLVKRGDVVQMSAVRAVVRHCDDPRLVGWPVAPYGYVRLVHGDRVIWEKVDLLPDAAVVNLWLAYWAANGRGMDGEMARAG
ncbi:MAG: hypothetical protein HQL38_03190 [Alphaproteobacteria bacterium]|nr:hypothetical protein [Alphaproteobacteria bacterium]